MVLMESFRGTPEINPDLTTQVESRLVFFEDTPPSPTLIGPAFAPGSFFAAPDSKTPPDLSAGGVCSSDCVRR